MIVRFVSNLKLYISIILISICCISIPKICNAAVTHTFWTSDISYDVPFYFKSEFSSKSMIKGKTKTLHDETEIWYRDPKHIRLEVKDVPGDGMTSYMIRSGNSIFSTITKEKDRSQRWSLAPSSWSKKSILSFTQIRRDWKISDAVLIGKEKMNGIDVQHWRSSHPDKRDGISNAWVCTNIQYPFVIKFEYESPKNIFKWEIKTLKFNEQIPDYYFSPQINPKAGIAAQLKMQFKPLWLLMSWFCALLFTFIYLSYSIAAQMTKTRRIINLILSSFLFIAANHYKQNFVQYAYSYSWIPLFFLMFGIFALSIIYCHRKFGSPKDVQYFKGMHWSVIPIGMAFMAVAFINAYKKHLLAIQPFNIAAKEGIGILHMELVPTMLILLTIAAIYAAIEEMIFRGYIFSELLSKFRSRLAANSLQSLLYTLYFLVTCYSKLYISSIFQLIGVFLFCLFLGWLRLRYRNLGMTWIIRTMYYAGLMYAPNLVNYALQMLINNQS